MTPEQQEQYIKWINGEIGMAISNEEGARAHALVQAKEKFLSLIQPQSINNDKTGDTR